MKSLGPKPTAKQMETLKKMAIEGVVVHWWSGLMGNDPDSASIVYPGSPAKVELGISYAAVQGDREVLRTDTLGKFIKWGWLESFGDPGWKWRNNEYRITEKGRRVVEMGEIRK